MSKLSIKEIMEKSDKISKSNPLKYMKNGSKTQKKKKEKFFSPHFHPIARVWVLSNRVADTRLQRFLLSSLHSFESTFSGIV